MPPLLAGRIERWPVLLEGNDDGIALKVLDRGRNLSLGWSARALRFGNACRKFGL